MDIFGKFIDLSCKEWKAVFRNASKGVAYEPIAKEFNTDKRSSRQMENDPKDIPETFQAASPITGSEF